MLVVASKTILSGDQMMKNSLRFSKLRVESLEERTLLAVMAGGVGEAALSPSPTEATTWVVNTLDDPVTWDMSDDVVSLREAIGRAVTDDTIVFDGSLAGGTITFSEDKLNTGCLEIYEGITIDASSIGGITIDAGGNSRVFHVSGSDSDITVNLISLVITGGKTDDEGGGIDNIFATLTLTNCIVTGNYAKNGGGISNLSGTMTLTNCTISENTASGYLSGDIHGCGIYNGSATLVMTNCLVYGNTGGTNATAIYNLSGSLKLFSSTVSNNKSTSIANDMDGTVEFYNSIVLNVADSHNYYAYSTLSDYSRWSESENCLTYDSFKPLFSDPLNSDFSLALGSQAADCGNNGYAITETDIDGKNRIMFGITDLGAYESQWKRDEHEPETPSTVVTTEKDVIDDSDGLISIREAISYASDGDTVTFDESLSRKTILLAGTELSVNKSLVVDASDIGGITIDGNDLSRVLCVNVQDGNGTVELKSLTMKNGHAYLQNGGGIYSNFSSLKMTDCIVTENAATLGGGIHCYGGTATITSCAISGNSADDSGGGILIESNGIITVTNSTIFGNSATDCAGGIYKELGSLVTVTSSTISGNSAGFGGGIFTDYGVLSITNSIVALNYANEGNDIYGNPTFSGNNLIGIDPGFVVSPIFVEGKISNLEELDLSLTAESWAIDRGINAAVNVETDLSGSPRIRAAWKDFPTVDIGAYEFQGKTEVKPTWTVTTANDIVDDNDGLISLREAISKAKDGETVVFDSALSGGTITLSPRLGGLRISKSIAIDATSIGGITINATEYDGGFYIYNDVPGNPVELIMLTITGGRNYYYGGGITNSSALSIINSTISGNSSDSQGGGIYNQRGGALTIINSTISGNSANYGGGIYNECGIVTVTNSVISGNSADTRGGGIFHPTGADDYGYWTFNYSLLTLTNTTVSGNTSYLDGGIYSNTEDISYGFTPFFYDFTPLTITNSIIALNYSGCDNPFGYYFAGGNNIIDSDPGFVAAPVFDEQGKLTNLDELNLSLTAESQAIDVGENFYVATKSDVAGNPRIMRGIVDIGAYEYQYPLDVPEITTGTPGVYVSAGANRHRIIWDAVLDAVEYELAYSTNGTKWTTVSASDTSTLITGLPYGADVQYRIRAIGDGTNFSDSVWSEIKMFNVCPMDINNDGDIGGIDRVILAQSWLAEEGDDDYIPAADIDGNGDVGGIDRAFLANNWLNEVDVDDMIYPRPLASELALEIDGQPMSVLWEENESVAALRDLVSKGPLNIQMSMYGGFEQVGSIGTSLPRNDVRTTATAGDIVLYSGNQIVLFYGSNSWSYTRLGRISDRTADELTELLGSGNVALSLALK